MPPTISPRSSVLDPSIAGFYDNRQNAFRRAGRFQDALNDANRAMQMAPTYSFVYRGRGNVYKDMGQLNLAMNDYVRAIQINPGDGGLFIDWGKILEKMGRVSDAISDFSHALELDRKWIAGYRERGLAFKGQGQTDAALSDLSLFTQLQPDDQEAAQALADLQRTKAAASVPVTVPIAASPPIVTKPSQVASTETTAQPSNGVGQASEIPMEKSGGIFVLPVSINGAITLKFVIDSGAADVSIPADVVLTLIRTGTLRSEDFRGSKTYVLADGSTVPSETFQIRTLKVGDREIENVTASVADIKGTLLLGQSFLNRFKSWSVDNEREVLLLR